MSYAIRTGVLSAALLLASAPLVGQEHGHRQGEGHSHGGLHFTHPLITESISPDTKVRLDYRFRDLEAADRHLVGLDAEYAFHRSFSIEVGVPYVFLDRPEGDDNSRLGNVELVLKFANFAFAGRGVLLGYGLELGLPTGSEEAGIGSDHVVEVEPFLNAGYRRGGVEAVGFVAFGIPTNLNPEDEVETELGYNLALLYHVGPRVEALVELDGESVLSSEENEDRTVLNLTPGIRVRPLADRSFVLGVGAGFPLTGDQEFDTRVVVSAFYHFR